MPDLSPIWISLKTAITATTIAFFLGTICAWQISQYQGKFKSLIDSICLSPLVLPPTVVGFILLLLFGKQGPIGLILQKLGITVIFTWYATVIAASVVAFPLMYKTALGAFQQIDQNTIACARTLGASEWRIFWQIMSPLAQPGLIAGILLAFTRALGEFGATLMLAGSIPGETQTIPIAIFLASESGDFDQAWLGVLIILAISLTTIFIVNFYLAQKRTLFTPKVMKPDLFTPKLIKPNFFTPINSPELIVNITKKLPNYLLDVEFTADAKPVGLLGASGSGKTMLLRCIAGLETPDRGQIILNGQVLFDSTKKINLPSRDRNLGMLFQNYALFPHLTVWENIAFGLYKSKNQPAIIIENLLLAMELIELRDRYPDQLSGGQQQRVALARALANQPAILLLDEPFSALDTYLRDRLEKLLIFTLNNYPGITLFVTHNLEEAYRVCEDLLVIDQGKIIRRDAKQNIFDRPLNKTTAVITGCKNFSRAISLNSQQIQAIDWDCTLNVITPIFPDLSEIGIRAYQIIFLPDHHHLNTFPCWLAMTSETQHRITLYLKLHRPAKHPQDYHIQAEVFKEKWTTIKARPLPWFVQLHPAKLMLLNL